MGDGRFFPLELDRAIPYNLPIREPQAFILKRFGESGLRRIVVAPGGEASRPGKGVKDS